MTCPPGGQRPNRTQLASSDPLKDYTITGGGPFFSGHFDPYILAAPTARRFIPNEDTGYHPGCFAAPQSYSESVDYFGFSSSIGRPDHVSNTPLHHKAPNVNLITQTYHQGALFMNLPTSQMTASMGPSLQLNVARVMPRGHKFECETCHRTFDRHSRLENCRNRHLSVRPHMCMGRCGSPRCSKKYASIDHLDRHIHPYGTCPSCGESHLKQNMSRHREACTKRAKGKL